MNDLKNWTEITKGLYRYVIGANVCYEIHILHWDRSTDILTAKASAYLVGEWFQSIVDNNGYHKNAKLYFEREPILLEQSVFECLRAVVKDDKENNNG